MAPFKSSLSRSATKLIGVFRDRDTSLRGYKQTSREAERFEVTGGTKIESGGYTYHVFTADTPSPESNLIVNAVALSKNAQILVVGGGGEGAKDDGGGGGAGSVVYDPTFLLTGSNSYAVTVGGEASTIPSTNNVPGFGAVGNPSSFGDNFLAKGGGSGIKTPSIPGSLLGGSGGGGAYPGVPGSNAVAPGNIPPSATSYQNNGGDAGSPSAVEGGGGGGAGSAGAQGHPSSGAGGNGRAFPEFPGPVISPAVPSPEQSAFQTAVGPTGLFGGGGGAGGRQDLTSGGPGGGGDGGYPGSSAGNPGIYGTGGGGGGTGGGGATSGGNGASGIVIVRYTT